MQCRTGLENGAVAGLACPRRDARMRGQRGRLAPILLRQQGLQMVEGLRAATEPQIALAGQGANSLLLCRRPAWRLSLIRHNRAHFQASLDQLLAHPVAPRTVVRLDGIGFGVIRAANTQHAASGLPGRCQLRLDQGPESFGIELGGIRRRAVYACGVHARLQQCLQRTAPR